MNVLSYCTLRVANAVADEMNSEIIWIERRVGGFGNLNDFTTAIYFTMADSISADGSAGWTQI